MLDMYSPRRYSAHAFSLIQQDHHLIPLLLETNTMTVIKDPKELRSELIIAEAYVVYWEHRANHIEQLTELAARDTRAMLAKAQSLLDILRRGDKPAPQRATLVQPAPATAVDDLLREEQTAGEEFL